MFNDFFESWEFLRNHVYFIKLLPTKKGIMFEEGFEESLEIMVVKVNPETNCVECDKKKNTKTRIWLECGGYDINSKSFYHEVDLDTGGDTFEEAIINLANIVYKIAGIEKIDDFMFQDDVINTYLTESAIEKLKKLKIEVEV